MKLQVASIIFFEFNRSLLILLSFPQTHASTPVSTLQWASGITYQHLDSLPWGELAGAQITPLGPLAGNVYVQRAWLHLTVLQWVAGQSP